MSDRPDSVLSSARLALGIRRFREERPDSEMLDSEPIAIIGIGCRFPGNVRSPEDCWRVLAAGIDAITEIPADRWPVEKYYNPDPTTPGKTNSRWGGFVSDPSLFDPVLFGISPREAVSMDPQQRLLLEVAWEAIQDSGRSAESLTGSRTGVFAGIGMSEYERLLFEDELAVNANTCTGAYHSVASGRISYLLDLRGPSVSLDTACSSSLVAIHMACQSLRSGESDLALAGGVALHLLPDHYIGLARLGMLAPDGRCKTFDESANGFVPSDGCGLVVLKRLSESLANGDRIYAVVRGSAINQDGRTNSLTAPSGLAQEQVVRAALRNARVPPSYITYIETHGTGTALGDPIEVEALAATVGKAVEGLRPCALGAVKTNFGHMEAAAGVAGLIKTALALHHEEIPANLHFKKLNPHISLEGTRFLFPTSAMSWQRGNGPRFAGISSFGFSGTNAHVVLEEAPLVPAHHGTFNREGACVLTVSARTAEALKAAVRQHRDFLGGVGRDVPLYDICRTSAVSRSHYEERLALTASTNEEMRGLMDDFIEGRCRSTIAYGRGSVKPDSVVFVCSGQGSQWPGMGISLLRKEPVFRAAIEECEEWIGRWAGWSLQEELSAPESASRLTDTEYAQPAIFAMEVALARLFDSWGIRPAAIIGHSAGEVAAAQIAGVLSLSEATRVVVERGRLMQAATGLGKMAVVRLPAAVVMKEFHDGSVSIAAINSPHSTVISGNHERIDELLAVWRKRGVACVVMPVNYAFHSAQMQPFSEELVRVLGTVDTHPGKIPIISTVVGRAVSGKEFGLVYWGRNIRSCVQFAAAMDAACSMGLETFIEIGAHPVLLSSIGECLAGLSHQGAAISSLRRNQDERTTLLSSLGTLHAAGHPVLWESVYREPANPVALPPYPYQRQRFWMDQRIEMPTDQLHPLVGTRLRSPSLSGAVFETKIGTTSLPYLADHRIEGAVMLPMTAFLEMTREAVRQTIGAERALADITVLESLPLIENTTARVQVIIKEDRFEVHSLAGEDWKLHSSGRIVDPTRRDGLLEPTVEREVVTSGAFYTALRELGAEFGPAFRTIHSLTAGQEKAWAEVRLGDSERQGAGRYTIHPALFDGCLQTASALAHDGGLFLPFAIDQFECFASAGGEVRVNAHRLPSAADDILSADIDIWGKDGTPVARVRGLHLKRRSISSSQRKVYEAEWRVIPRGRTVKPADGLWVVAGENLAAVQKLAAALNQDNVTAKAADAANAIESAGTARGLIWLMDGRPDEQPAQAFTRTAGSVVSLTQELLRRHNAPPQLWLVTQGAVAADAADACAGLFQSPVWGIARSIAMEHPELACVRVDLDPAAPDFDELAKEIANWDGEDEIALRPSGRYAHRLVTRLAGNREPQRWTIPSRGSLENLALVGMTRHAPSPGQVEVEINASALNFRDVLNVLGMYPGDAGQPGFEFCGRIVRVGEGVPQYHPGDLVMGIAWGCFASFVNTHAALVAPVPQGLSSVEAATIPNAFLTVFHCLIHLGRLRCGERILIHAAAGGIGLAAVQLAMHIGAEIFATAGSAQKRDYLRSIGVTHIFDSRTLEFQDQIDNATGGKGVDLVLNSLAGDSIEASFSVVAKGGRFIEIGKNQIWAPERVASLGKDIEYQVVDLADQLTFDRPLIQAHFSSILHLLKTGAIHPLPVQVFRFEEAPTAFQYMAHAKHTGKIVLRHPMSPQIRSDATYLITGGLGSLGLHAAKWLVQRGARSLVLAGRDGPAMQAIETIGLLRQKGARIEIRSLDVANRDEVDLALRAIDRELPPLAGILHAAGVLDDGIFMEQTWARMEKVMAPKILGAWNLHELTVERPLDFFLLFSSVASLTGSPGQSGYAAANAFLDALAHYRCARGLAALSINWGPWTEGGMATRVKQAGRRRVLPGLRPMSAEQCLAALESAMGEDLPQVAIADTDWSGWNPMPRLLSSIAREVTLADTTPVGPDIAHRLEAASLGGRRGLLLDHLRHQVISILGLSENELYIDERQSLLRMGMDSLMAVEFRNRLAADLHRPLSATLLFDHPTIGALADLLSGHSARETSPSPQDALLQELETLSDSDSEELLKEELERS